MTVARMADRSAASAADEADGGAQDAVAQDASQSWDLGSARRAERIPRSSAQLQLLRGEAVAGRSRLVDAKDQYGASGINVEVTGRTSTGTRAPRPASS